MTEKENKVIKVEPAGHNWNGNPQVKITDHNGRVYYQGFVGFGDVIYLYRSRNDPLDLAFGWMGTWEGYLKYGSELIAVIRPSEHNGKKGIEAGDIFVPSRTVLSWRDVETQKRLWDEWRSESETNQSLARRLAQAESEIKFLKEWLTQTSGDLNAETRERKESYADLLARYQREAKQQPYRPGGSTGGPIELKVTGPKRVTPADLDPHSCVRIDGKQRKVRWSNGKNEPAPLTLIYEHTGMPSGDNCRFRTVVPGAAVGRGLDLTNEAIKFVAAVLIPPKGKITEECILNISSVEFTQSFLREVNNWSIT